MASQGSAFVTGIPVRGGATSSSAAIAHTSRAQTSAPADSRPSRVAAARRVAFFGESSDAMSLGSSAVAFKSAQPLRSVRRVAVPQEAAPAAPSRPSRSSEVARCEAATASYPEQLVLRPIKTVNGVLDLPGSKSLSNRILLLSALSEGTTMVENLLDSDDVRMMVGALHTMKIPLEEDRAAKKVKVTGCGGKWPVEGAELFLGNAGTAMRPLTAAVCLGKGRFVLDGIQRMRERPIIDLVDGLQQLGVKISCSETGCPPVVVEADGLPGGETRLSGAISSQFLSAILMAAPYAKGDVRIVIKDKLVSVPYVEMTVRLMERFGVKVECADDYQSFLIRAGQRYVSPGTAFVEGDASSASYFLSLAAITGGSVTLKGCGTESLQGDVNYAKVMEMMGARVEWTPHSVALTGTGELRGIDIDMNAMPDAAMSLAVVALFAKGRTAIRNIYNWRVKETERMVAVATELRKLGATVEEGEDYIVIDPPAGGVHAAAIDTYDDHRMAMAFSLAACGDAEITINDPGCVRKTFPDYFDVLAKMVTLR
eukprot:tig00000711_g3400.t1